MTEFLVAPMLMYNELAFPDARIVLNSRQGIRSKGDTPYDTEAVITWYKFKILENLSGRLVRISSPALPPPEEMLPLNPDEFLIAQYGGTVVIDKLALTTVARDFPPFSLSEKYLLFVAINPDGVAGFPGPKSVFKMDSKGHLEPVNNDNEPQPLKDDIAYRLQSSVDELRRDLKNRFPFE